MSYQDQADLVTDGKFSQRVHACATEQSEIFKDDARPNYVALANAVMKSDGDALGAFVNLTAAAPGIAEKAATDNGIDQSQVTDDDLLASVQALWPVVAGLYFTDEGEPK